MKHRVALTAVLGAIGVLIASAGAAAAPTAPIHPGVQTLTNGGQCTSNFIFRDATSTYIGQAAHCSGTGAATSTNGCTSGSLPVGTPVTVTGASRPGTLVYNSWLTMQALHESDANTCRYNDLALVRLDPADAANVDPSVPGFGGPTRLGTVAGQLSGVYSYGNSKLRLGVAALSPKQGTVVQVTGGGWSRTVLTVTPGIPGDSGSGFMNATGEAIGVLSTLMLAPLPATNGVGDLARELDYLHAHTEFTGVKLVPGTRPFNGNLLGAILGL
jgi:hypothetical protein